MINSSRKSSDSNVWKQQKLFLVLHVNEVLETMNKQNNDELDWTKSFMITFTNRLFWFIQESVFESWESFTEKLDQFYKFLIQLRFSRSLQAQNNTQTYSARKLYIKVLTPHIVNIPKKYKLNIFLKQILPHFFITKCTLQYKWHFAIELNKSFQRIYFSSKAFCRFLFFFFYCTLEMCEHINLFNFQFMIVFKTIIDA